MPNQPTSVSRPILIIDDVASEALTLGLLCRALGVETISAASAAEASKILSQLRPAAIITDLVMPGADGLDCLFMIAGFDPTVPVMVTTASERLLLKAAAELGENYGLSDVTCIAKPIDQATLTAFIARAGASHKPSQRNLH
jgi:two-component system response regulator (stage 0 sporulation protein F)